ncbi:AAA family ATPase [Pseudomonas sp. efr-133-TYG-103a]|uniref:AAA family ATPase n=1 Tax=Pseudomonas sp. efr-133-TYG-103a TaxID=3040308 RepID=UPI002555C4B1|nr:AAA family ATPase [Pseudomonas sp. efr-133-TYG-103a]
MALSRVFNIPTSEGSLELKLEAGRPVFILGRNGTGKSALIYKLAQGNVEKLIYMPGSRPNVFGGEGLSMTPVSRRELTTNLRYWDVVPEVRWKNLSGTARNERAIYDLQASEVSYNAEAVRQIRNEDVGAAVALLRSGASPLERVNAILAQASLPVRILVLNGELQAERGDAVYSFAKMSDGERSALVFTAEVVAAPEDSIFIIDEPEVHLHPAIAVPLLRALMTGRPDCGFIVATHELSLPQVIDPATFIIVRDCTWGGADVLHWDMDLIEDTACIPDWLRADILGSRNKILFVEGDSTSLDQPLYALLYPDVSVWPRENCREVMRAVEGLKAVDALHRIAAYGLVDLDGMEEGKVLALESNGIFSLPYYSVESLYYCLPVRTAVARRHAELLGGDSDAMLLDAKVRALSALESRGTIEHLASRLAERRMRDLVMNAIPSREQMLQAVDGTVRIDIESPYRSELGLLSSLLEERDIDGVIARYPIRESGVLNCIAKALRFNGPADYEGAALRVIGADENLRLEVKAMLGGLSRAIESDVEAR